MKIFKYYILVCIVTVPYLFASTPDSLAAVKEEKFIVDSILISGNDITEPGIILRELTFSEGDTISAGMLPFNRERIYSLGLFSKVTVSREKKQIKNLVLIDVAESWYIYPLPVVNLENSSFDKASYGFNILYKNFRGRNETINTYVTFGYDPTISLQYYVPVLVDESNISMSTRAYYMTSQNKSPAAEKLIGKEFDNKFIYYELVFGKRLDIYNTIFLSGSYRYVEAKADVNFNLLPGISKLTRYPSLGMAYELDTRDLKQFPGEGYYITGQWIYNGFGLKDIDYNVLKVDYREYRHVTKKILTKWRLLGRHSFGSNIPFFDKSYFGYDEIVRGHKDDVREGNNYILSSIEVKYPLVEEWDFSIKLPLLPRKLTSARIAIYVEGFGDTGLTFNNNDKLRLKDLYSGYGAGLTFLFLPYNAARIAYAINEYKKGEIIFGTGFSF